MSKRDSYEDLYTSKSGTASWYDSISSEAKDWLIGLAEHIQAKGRPPIWSVTHERFQELFPDDCPKAASTISATVRRLIGE